ncbi:hypothetical protein D3C76_701940 [compost metagenome]
MQVARTLVEQLLNQLVGKRGFHMVIVVDNQVELFAQLGRSLDDNRDAGLQRRLRGVLAEQVNVHFNAQPPQSFEKR